MRHRQSYGTSCVKHGLDGCDALYHTQCMTGVDTKCLIASSSPTGRLKFQVQRCAVADLRMSGEHDYKTLKHAVLCCAGLARCDVGCCEGHACVSYTALLELTHDRHQLTEAGCLRIVTALCIYRQEVAASTAHWADLLIQA